MKPTEAPKQKDVTAEEVVKSLEEGFKERVLPLWREWRKQVWTRINPWK